MTGESRLADHEPGIPDEATRHYDEPALAALVLAIATINVWNRLNVNHQADGELLAPS